MQLFDTATASDHDMIAFCTIRPGDVKGINQHRAIQHGKCPHHGERFRREVDWHNRTLGEWERVES